MALASEAIEATLEVEVLRFWILAGGPSLLQAPRPRFDPPFSLLVAGFDPQDGTAHEGLLALAIAYGWLPILAKLAAIGLMWNFPLDETLQKSLRERITSA